jgi:hypothetical protein
MEEVKRPQQAAQGHLSGILQRHLVHVGQATRFIPQALQDTVGGQSSWSGFYS